MGQCREKMDDGERCKRRVADGHTKCTDHDPKANPHRPGRPAELKDPKRVLLRLESKHLRVLDQVAKRNDLRGRAAAVRFLLDNFDFAA